MTHWSRLVFLVSALCAFQALWVSGAQAERRLALIVGIDQYDNLDNLQKAGNDARSVSTTLEQLGFVVTTLIDVDRRKLGRSIASFSSSIQPGDEVVFFFAGHGVELDGRNYLLPADVPKAEPGEEEFLKLESIAANDLSPLFKSQGARVSVLIIDACRENPFPKQGTRSLGGQGGLARMDPAEGAFILFSAASGQLALDRLSNADPNPNSVFTRALLPRLSQPGLQVHDLVRQVRQDVRKMAGSVNHNQFPAYYDQLAGAFSFNPGAAGAAVPAVVPVQPPAVVTPINPCDAARADWQVLQTTNSTGALEQFAQQHQSCPIYVAAAQDRLASLRAAQPAPQPVQPTPQVVQPAPVIAGGASLCERLWYERNLIYHNRGYCFQTSRAKAVFDTSQCSTRAPSLTAAELSEVERLKAAEKANGC